MQVKVLVQREPEKENVVKVLGASFSEGFYGDLSNK